MSKDNLHQFATGCLFNAVPETALIKTLGFASRPFDRFADYLFFCALYKWDIDDPFPTNDAPTSHFHTFSDPYLFDPDNKNTLRSSHLPRVDISSIKINISSISATGCHIIAIPETAMMKTLGFASRSFDRFAYVFISFL